ncbi:hypothetical protein HY407_02480 [Candidatus Gottesmanbacteria bacterium]|nr:hypothetical protein [Candidatus Gottesmanbacteria bacterium]
MKHIVSQLAQATYDQKDEWKEVMYSLMVRRDAMKASHLRMVKKLKAATWH